MPSHTLALKANTLSLDLMHMQSRSRKVLVSEREQCQDLRLSHTLRKLSLFLKKPCVHQQRAWPALDTKNRKQNNKKRSTPKEVHIKALSSEAGIKAKWLWFHFHWLDSRRLSLLWINIWFILQFDFFCFPFRSVFRKEGTDHITGVWKSF